MKTRDGKGGSGSEGCGTARGAPCRPRERKGAISRRPRERKGAISRLPRERKGAISRLPRERMGAISRRPRERKGAISRRPRERKDAISRRPRERKDAISLRSRVSTAVATMAVTEASRVRCAGRGRRRRRACGLVLLLRNISNNPRHCGPGKCAIAPLQRRAVSPRVRSGCLLLLRGFHGLARAIAVIALVMTVIAGLLRYCGVYCGRCGGTSACTSTSSRTW